MKIKLLKMHEHEGRVFAVGSVLTMDDAAASWLIEQGVAEQYTGASPQRATSSEPRKRTVRSCCGW